MGSVESTEEESEESESEEESEESEEESSEEESSEEESSEEESSLEEESEEGSSVEFEETLKIPPETENGTACMKCLITEDDVSFLLCDHDDSPLHGGHFYCFGMDTVPTGDWFCPLHCKLKCGHKSKKKSSKKPAAKSKKNKKSKKPQKPSKKQEKPKSKKKSKAADDDDRPLVCFFCEKRFSSAGYLKRHMNRFHRDQKEATEEPKAKPKV